MNRIFYLNQLPNKLCGKIVIIDGKTNKTSKDFLQSIWSQLKFPDIKNCNWDAYLDWMRDLSWLEMISISIVILNYSYFLSEEPNYRQYFISDFQDIIFPFWENDAMDVFQNQDYIKKIDLYCIEEYLPFNSLIPIAEILPEISNDIVNGQKIPHSISCPVLRMNNNQLYLTCFSLFFNKEQLKTEMVNRPTQWALINLENGNIIEKYNTDILDFSNGSYQKLYDISLKNVFLANKEFWISTYNLMDIIRFEYINKGILREDLYKEYLERIYDTTPKSYHIFYQDLTKSTLLPIKYKGYELVKRYNRYYIRFWGGFNEDMPCEIPISENDARQIVADSCTIEKFIIKAKKNIDWTKKSFYKIGITEYLIHNCNLSPTTAEDIYKKLIKHSKICNEFYDFILLGTYPLHPVTINGYTAKELILNSKFKKSPFEAYLYLVDLIK